LRTDSGHLALPQDGDYRTAVVSAMSPEMEAVIRAVSYAPGRGTAVGRALLERRVVADRRYRPTASTPPATPPPTA